MAAPLFVVVKRDALSNWALQAGPTDAAGAIAAVQAALNSAPTARACVLALARSFTATAVVAEDGTATIGP